MTATNESERFVHELCRSSFLSLWSIENPLGPKGKELCDALLVMGDHVVVISVKDCRVTDSGDESVDLQRWQRRAVDASVKQLSGAVRTLSRLDGVRRRDNPNLFLPLPPSDQRQVHRVAVALGADDRVSIGSTDYDFGFVHVFDRETAEVLLEELDTVADFVGYLEAKEEFSRRTHCIMEGGEKDLLAIYLREGRKFPQEPDLLFLHSGLWDQASSRAEFIRRKQADKISYTWDRLVEEFAGHLRGGTVLRGALASETEKGLRYMAMENRFSRRALSESFVGLLRGSKESGSPWSRTVPAASGVVYVFATCPTWATAAARTSVLGGYCSILREDYPDANAIVGIITEVPSDDWRQSFGLMLIEGPPDDEIRSAAAEARKAGILQELRIHRRHYKEYPDSSTASE